MIDLLSGVFRWLIRQALTLLLILGVLVSIAWVNGELIRAEQLSKERVTLAGQQIVLSREIAELKHRALERFHKSQFFESMLRQKKAERQKLWDSNFWTRHIPGTDAWIDIRVLDLEIEGFQKILDGVARASESGGRKQDALERTKAEIERQITDLDATLAKSWVSRFAAIVNRELPVALIVLAGVILLPIGIKAFLYFVVAPWAASRPPLRLLPDATGRVTAGGEAGKVSAVSIPVVLAEREELFVLPGYLQSSPLQGKKNTRWLLNWSVPLSSLLSGMYLLTRVGDTGSEPIVVSATSDPLSEIGIVDLEEGAAFVCRPRALAGLIQDRRAPILITRHWRLASLQAWLTLQFRFLAFHGPGRLILKGCRGVRMEQGRTGRLINQAATLGFSANIAYANARCETFVSYWSGKEDLFNDLFSGESGVFVYEETPDSRRASGIGRPLEGLADAVLKAFGV